MKNSKFLNVLFFAGVMIFSLQSCRKKTDDPRDNLVFHKDVIIGCKTGQPIKLGFDPIKSQEFNHNKGLYNTAVVGPSCLNDRKDLYYTAGDDKIIKEIEISSGTVKRSFQTTNHVTSMHYRKSDNVLIYVEPTKTNYEYAVFKLDLNSGNGSSLFKFTSQYGMAVRTSFLRNNDLVFMNGMAELMKLDLSSANLTNVGKLKRTTNSMAYDGVLDKVFYLASVNAVDFSLYCYNFSNNSDVLLKNYPDIKTHMLGSTTYNSGNNNYYFYNASSERITINVVSLDKKVEKVQFPLFNTEIVDCMVKLEDMKEQ